MRLFNLNIFIAAIVSMILFATCTLKRDNPLDIKGTSYGKNILSITTTPATQVSQTSAQSSGTIYNISSAIISAGICYATNNNPTIADMVVYTSSVTGVFTCNISGINPNTTYFVKAFATTNSGTVYGDTISFTTLTSTASTLPSLTTANASLITSNTAQSGGHITSTGGSSVTARGVCWNTSPGATISLATKTNDGNGTGVFTSNILSLTANTKYYVRAYATNSNGTSYGNEMTFTTTNSTGPTIPALSTIAVSSINQSSAQSGGVISSDGGSTITKKGVCWSTSSGPTATNVYLMSNDGGTSNFISSISGLSSGTKYYVRAYASNSVGTAYGNELTFNTPFEPCSITSSTTGTTFTMQTPSSTTFYQGNSYAITMYSPTYSFGQATNVALYKGESLIYSFGTYLLFSGNSRTFNLPSGLPSSNCYTMRVTKSSDLYVSPQFTILP